ncbi:MAG: hypothetical protein ACR2MO_07070 [Acidimicrobiales bacterium]
MVRSRTAGPGDSFAPPSDEAFRAWDDRGLVLLERLRIELGPDIVVGYGRSGSADIDWPEET